jgi:hypothetical protein
MRRFCEGNTSAQAWQMLSWSWLCPIGVGGPRKDRDSIVRSMLPVLMCLLESASVKADQYQYADNDSEQRQKQHIIVHRSTHPPTNSRIRRGIRSSPTSPLEDRSFGYDGERARSRRCELVRRFRKTVPGTGSVSGSVLAVAGVLPCPSRCRPRLPLHAPSSHDRLKQAQATSVRRNKGNFSAIRSK